MKLDLRPGQAAIVNSDDPHLVVVAGAGAGKTSVLVRRYLRFVKAGISPEAILCITFTRKAAAQMKQRIVDELRTEGLLLEAQAAEIGPIQTLHALCERLLRENALSAGLDPDFQILSDSNVAMLREEAIQAVLTDPPDDEGVADILLALAGKTTSNRTRARRTTPHARLEEALLGFMDRLRGSGRERADLAEGYRSSEATLATWAGILGEHLRSQLGKDLASPFDTAQLRADYQEARMRQPGWIKASGQPEAMNEAAVLTAGLVSLTCAAWRIYEQEMVRRQSLDFQELESRAVRLMERSESACNRVATTFQIMMVDEAQDLNPMQYRLLNSLRIGERLFVGDPYQSIYGWRHADHRLFAELAEAGPRFDLNENHRSEEGILNFVELIFGRLWGNDGAYRPMLKPGATPRELFDASPRPCTNVSVWRQPAENTSIVAAKICELREGLGKEQSIAVLVRGQRYGALLLTALEGKAPARLIGGTDRYYARLEIRDVANTLRALADPYDDFALLASLRSPFCGLSMDGIALLALRKPSWDALTDFVSPVEDDGPRLERFLGWFRPLSAWADRMPAWEVLSEVFAVSGFWEALAERPNGRQAIANVRKLLTLAVDAPDADARTFAERIREIQRMNHPEGDAPAESAKDGEISILTIHKAKGLEWDAVVVPDLFAKVDGQRSDVELDPHSGLASCSFSGLDTLPHAFARALRLERETAEAQRLLYVALTRARSRLCVVADTRAPEGSMAKKLAVLADLDKNRPPGLTVVDAS